jgi:DtxR family transcriptional regulator, Mn-dependent transcriptional regulator
VLNILPYNTVYVITVSKEDYLKAILEAESEGETVISATLAHWLKVSPPAVTMALRRLKRDGLVRVNTDGRVRLSAAGRKIARKLTLRHHLIERMLAEIFGMEWYKVHDEAEQLEHAVSADFERKLIDKLGTERECPHGNAVGMDSPGERRKRGLKPLDEARRGDRLVVVSVFERDRKLLEYLDGVGIRPGVRVEISAVDGEIELRTAGRTVRLERGAAGKVWAGNSLE